MITFICALPQEAKYLRKLPSVQSGQTQLVCSGVGPKNANRATRDCLGGSKPSLVISTGVAGALTPTLRVGDVVVAREVIDEVSGNRFSCTTLSSPHSALGTLLSVSRMITSAEEKKALAARFSAVAVDMESAAIAAVCVEHGVPFAAIRAISDTAEEVLPKAVTRFFDERGGLRPGSVMVELLKQPSLLKALRRLQAQTSAAGESLCRFLQSHPM